jgi:hypothetical protein
VLLKKMSLLSISLYSAVCLNHRNKLLPSKNNLLDFISVFLFPDYFQFVQALLEYEKHKRETGELQLPGSVPVSTRVEKEVEFSLYFSFD